MWVFGKLVLLQQLIVSILSAYKSTWNKVHVGSGIVILRTSFLHVICLMHIENTYEQKVRRQ